MSLINRMLQDLDARGGNGAVGGAPGEVMAVRHEPRSRALAVAVGAGVALVVLAGGVYAGWKTWQASHPAPAVAARAASPKPALAAQDDMPPRRPSNISEAEHRAAANRMDADMAERMAAARKASPQRKDAQAMGDADKVAAPTPRATREAPELKARAEAKVQEAAKSSQRMRAQEMARVTGKATVAAGGDASNYQQQGENAYRRALARLSEGRNSEAVAALEQAVDLAPRHMAARQTLVSLLIEQGRPADAVRHLQLATRLDPRQLDMAMLLARIQIEQGGSGLDTLQRSQPYAAERAEFQAMLGGVLQRAARHAEAAEHYQAALRLQPANGVWWMGLGISLQAEKRNADARSAYQRALGSGALAPELQSFVDSRLRQLGN